MAEAKQVPTAKKEENPKEKRTALIFSDPAGNADKKCFFITPIGDDNSLVRRETDGIYIASVLPALKRCGIEEGNVNVSHKICTSGRIDKQIMMHLFEDDLVIANLTEQNPNVMYELAIRHFTGKPVILIARKGTPYPFDVHNERTISFVNDIMGSKDLIIEIEKEIRALDNYKADNIIYESVKEDKIQEAISATKNYTIPSETMEIFMETMNSMTSFMRIIDQKIDNGNYQRPELSYQTIRNRGLESQINDRTLTITVPQKYSKQIFLIEIKNIVKSVALDMSCFDFDVEYLFIKADILQITFKNITDVVFDNIKNRIRELISDNIQKNAK